MASITRIIELLVSKKCLSRESHIEDRRRFQLRLTKMGLSILKIVQPLSSKNRAKALNGISEREIKVINKILQKIMLNVSQ